MAGIFVRLGWKQHLICFLFLFSSGNSLVYGFDDVQFAEVAPDSKKLVESKGIPQFDQVVDIKEGKKE